MRPKLELISVCLRWKLRFTKVFIFSIFEPTHFLWNCESYAIKLSKFHTNSHRLRASQLRASWAAVNISAKRHRETCKMRNNKHVRNPEKQDLKDSVSFSHLAQSFQRSKDSIKSPLESQVKRKPNLSDRLILSAFFFFFNVQLEPIKARMEL